MPLPPAVLIGLLGEGVLVVSPVLLFMLLCSWQNARECR